MPGGDGISAELVKTTFKILVPSRTELFNKIVETGQIPRQWLKSEIILLHKKGSLSVLCNYRPISLIPVFAKLFSKAIQTRLKFVLNGNQSLDQAGLRKGFSTIDNLHAINQIIEKANEYQIPVYFCFCGL